MAKKNKIKEKTVSGKKVTLKERISNFFQELFVKIRAFFRTNKVIRAIKKGLGIFWHYFSYIFWPFKKLKQVTYDKLRYDQQKVCISVLFLLPVITGFLLFFIYPLVMSFVYSFSTLELVPGGPIIHFGEAFTAAAKKAGDYSIPDPSVKTIFFNYIYALRENADFPVELVNTLGQTFIDTAVITIFSLLIAVLLNGNFKGRGFARAIFFLPVIFNSEAIADAMEAASSFDSILGATGDGALASLFNMENFLIGLRVPKVLITFLGGITSTIYNTISYSGIQILIFLAAIQSVPKHLYEAAKIEGATKYESFWKITLPMVSPMIMTVVVYTVVDSFLRSDINDIIELQYTYSEYGYHAAMSWIYFLCAIIMLGIILGILSKLVFYYDEKK